MKNRKSQGHFRGQLMVFNMFFCIAMTIIALVMYLPFSLTGLMKQGFGSYTLFYIVLPFVMHLLCWGIVYSILKISENSERKNLIVLAGMSGHCAISVITFGQFPVIYLLGALPIVVSGGFGSKKLSLKTFGICIVFMSVGMLVPWMAPKTYDSTLWMNLLFAFFLLSIAYGVSLYLVSLTRQHQKTMSWSKNRQEELKHRLMTDQLTKLFNHTAFCQFMDQEFQKFITQNRTCTLAVIDIDNFKHVNDTYGHENGNVVLKNLAKILQTVAGTSGYVCRYGGEEFTILFPGLNGEEACAIMEKGRLRFAASRYPFLGEGQVTFSCGLQETYKGIHSAKDMIKKADKAMYDAKNGGKNQCVIGLKLYERAM